MKCLNTFLILLFFLLAANMTSCKKAKPSASEKEMPQQSEKKGESSTLADLYRYYTKNPRTQNEKEENSMIDYIAETGLSFERDPSGIYYRIEKAGSDTHYKWGGACTAHYRGYFLNGDVFDSSYKKQKPIKFRLGQMVNAWNKILQLVGPGAKLTLITPSRHAYGEEGFPNFVPPNTIIAFDIETLAG